MDRIRIAGSLILVVLLAAPALAFGVSPARKIYDVADTISGTLTVVNNQKESLDLYVVPRGDLASYVTVSPSSLVLTPSDVDATVKYTISVPKGTLTPGKHTIDLVVLTFQSGGAQDVISANAGVISQVVIDVPYTGAYIDSRIDYSKGDGNVVVPLFNRGSVDTTADVTLSIYGPTNDLLGTVRATGTSVKARGYTEVPLTLPTLNPGSYLLKAKIDYDGTTTNVQRVVDIGTPKLLVSKIDAELSGGIVKLSLPIESQWNEPTKEAYAIYDISTAAGAFVERVKTPTISLDPFGDGTLIGYWEAPGEGDYSVSLTVFYDGNTDTEEQTLSVTPTGVSIAGEAGRVTSSGTSGWLIFGVLMLVLINIVLITFVVRRRR